MKVFGKEREREIDRERECGGGIGSDNRRIDRTKREQEGIPSLLLRSRIFRDLERE